MVHLTFLKQRDNKAIAISMRLWKFFLDMDVLTEQVTNQEEQANVLHK